MMQLCSVGHWTRRLILPGIMWGVFFPLLGQQPDFSLDSFTVVSGKEVITGPGDIGAKLQVYCDGTYLSLVIEIRDNSVESNPGNYFTDHVELFFSLPPLAYPKGFEQRLHPSYIYSEPRSSRGEDPPEARHRFFSTYSEYTPQLRLDEFLSLHDYPKAQTIREDSLLIPEPGQLKQVRIDYGLVHLGLFPDGRDPVLYNLDHFRLLEKVLGFSLGDLTSGIIYTVDLTENGYLINVQVSPEALGFVVLPRMEEIYLAVDVVDTDFTFKRGATVVSSAPSSGILPPARGYNRVKLRQALATNFSPVPDRVFDQTRFFPTHTYTEQGWTPTAVEVDALAYKEQALSSQLTEIRFMRRPMRYWQELDQSQLLSIEQLTVEHSYVNAASKESVYTLVNNHLLHAEHLTSSTSPLGDPHTFTETFRFPDGKPGLIQVDNAILNPYGWGECGKCLDERIQVHRIEREGPRQILKIEQGEGNPSYCQIGEKNFDGFFVSRINWVKKGQLMVLQLSSRTQDAKKRVKVSWDEKGNDVKVEVLP